MVKSHHKVQWTSFQSVGRGILNLLILTEACLNRTNNTNKIYTQDIYIYVHVCVCVCARGRMCVLSITHVFAGVCQWKKPGQASGERM